MRTVKLYISKIDWEVIMYFAVTAYHIDDIVHSLEEIYCPDDILLQAKEHLAKGKLDTGLTYSNKALRKSVMVVGLTSSPAQFLNSFEHELRHLVDDIADTDDMPLAGEAVAYLTGDLNSDLWPTIHEFICCTHNCRCHES